ncbi:uncharacterized protein BDR25DRAFT_361144 [Lindgomyces ingoldianus]|uniref:Uncharacterized protein n=1 Tax=Lindgomyces ingoldianus TaxID=673940 RepID=A0ACB6QD77_9PLEO|nr:uncharacterized protein BDR25DRAFT_361144 [Lindgomyces ingoldianus]KAF2464923.1 hypothetical protein BDR25DRAFT_361144 [Lindgomyces ingoldianus]
MPERGWIPDSCNFHKHMPLWLQLASNIIEKSILIDRWKVEYGRVEFIVRSLDLIVKTTLVFCFRRAKRMVGLRRYGYGFSSQRRAVLGFSQLAIHPEKEIKPNQLLSYLPSVRLADVFSCIDGDCLSSSMNLRIGELKDILGTCAMLFKLPMTNRTMKCLSNLFGSFTDLANCEHNHFVLPFAPYGLFWVKFRTRGGLLDGVRGIFTPAGLQGKRRVPMPKSNDNYGPSGLSLLPISVLFIVDIRKKYGNKHKIMASCYRKRVQVSSFKDILTTPICNCRDTKWYFVCYEFISVCYEFISEYNIYSSIHIMAAPLSHRFRQRQFINSLNMDLR